MDEFRRIAGAYFQALEGWKLYPSFRTLHWYVWAASLVALIGTLLAVARVSNPGTAATAALLVAEAACAGVWLWIDAFKRASVLQAASTAFGADFDSIDAVRRARLEEAKTARARAEYGKTFRSSSENVNRLEKA